MGGPADGGITSGLNRQGYHAGGNGLSTQERLLRAVGPRRSNVYDFLTEWGLNMASMPPQGNVIQTGMAAAKDPHARFLKGKESEENLLRRVALEGEGIDIKAERDVLAADLDRKLKRELLTTRIEAEKDLYDLGKSEDLDALIEARAVEKIANNEFNNYATAMNEATWVYKTSKEYTDRRIGGVLTQKNLEDKKYAKNQKKKNPIGTIYFDPFSNRVLEIAVVEGEYILRPVVDTKGVHVDQPQTIEDSERQQIEAAATSLGIEYEIIPPRDEKFTGKDWRGYYKRTVNPKAVTLGELRSLISKEKFRLLVERKKEPRP